jgi:hypothetical protein
MISVESIEQEKDSNTHSYRLLKYEIEEIELPLLYINSIGQLMGGSLLSTDVCVEIYSKEIILGRSDTFMFI